MYEVFKMEKGLVTKTDEIQDNVWINMIRPTEEEIAEISLRLDIEKSVIAASLDDEEESRIEMEVDYSLILIDAPAVEIRNQREEYTTYPLSIIITPNAVVTVSLYDFRSIRSIIENKKYEIGRASCRERV